jgi:hypothetical protein
MEANMLQIIQPDYTLHVGVKDGKIVSTYWGELMLHHPTLSEKEVKREVSRLFREAAKRVEKPSKK